jgi:hypothetical protein
LTVDERSRLLEESVPEDPANPASRRYAMRRSADLEWFVAVLTEYRDGEPVFHGYPERHVPAKVLRVFRNSETITEVEYRRMTRELGR